LFFLILDACSLLVVLGFVQAFQHGGSFFSVQHPVLLLSQQVLLVGLFFSLVLPLLSLRALWELLLIVHHRWSVSSERLVLFDSARGSSWIVFPGSYRFLVVHAYRVFACSSEDDLSLVSSMVHHRLFWSDHRVDSTMIPDPLLFLQAVERAGFTLESRGSLHLVRFPSS